MTYLFVVLTVMTSRRHDVRRHETYDMHQECVGVVSFARLFYVSDPSDSVVRARDLHQGNKSLTDLDIGENKIGDEGVSALAEALKATFVLCARSSFGHCENFVARVC